ncbi:hypothetical protein DAPPUDRAFT_259129 [Daphnia pulex]|uniref:Uncharacterized protein n=1 Tax=Daphnia pulex TaxID=6669 RepID=E9HGL4_DAPPU|nr:hypothetical protein DAPPUDRAFT_259129 [Daphnia pulex]|eukprot:EFX69105.1 hypothetical protein DAPPUDRAFT_259129 [Daphnia pulex]
MFSFSSINQINQQQRHKQLTAFLARELSDQQQKNPTLLELEYLPKSACSATK